MEKGWPSSAALRKARSASARVTSCGLSRSPLVPGFVRFIDLVIRLGVILRRRFAQHLKLLRSLRDRHGARHGDLVMHIVGVRRERHLATGVPQFVAPVQGLLGKIFRRIFRKLQAGFACRFRRQRRNGWFGRGFVRLRPAAATAETVRSTPRPPRTAQSRQRPCASAAHRWQDSSRPYPSTRHFAATAAKSLTATGSHLFTATFSGSQWVQQMAGPVMDNPAN